MIAKTKTAKKKPTKKTATKPQRSTKVSMVATLLQQKDGCTAADVLSATGWPSVSMPHLAKLAGLSLTKKKVDGRNRYYGV